MDGVVGSTAITYGCTSARPVPATVQVAPELDDLNTPGLPEGCRVERRGGHGIDGQGLDVVGRQTCVDGNPRASPVGGLEDPASGKAARRRIEGGGSGRIDGEGVDVEGGQADVGRSPAAAAVRGLEDAAAEGPRVECGGSGRIDDEGGDVQVCETDACGRPATARVRRLEDASSVGPRV